MLNIRNINLGVGLRKQREEHLLTSSDIPESSSALDAVGMRSGTSVVVVKGERRAECSLANDAWEHWGMFCRHMLHRTRY